ncbi:hypothetical protein D3C87_2075020 [compost metagenome]
MVGTIHSRRIVDRVSVHQDARQCSLDPAALCDAKVAALSHDVGAELVGVHPDGVIGLIPDVGMGLC